MSVYAVYAGPMQSGASRMWATLTVLAFLFLALLHMMPAIAAVRPELVTSLYEVKGTDPAFLLLQHRAALFAAVMVLCLWAAFDPSVRPAAALVSAISMLSFLAIYAANGQPPRLRAIALADLAGLPALAWALWSAFRPGAAP
jgi:hypothetical protein